MTTPSEIHSRPRLPPRQQLAAADKWPIVGERLPARSDQAWSIAVEGEAESPVTWSLDRLRALPKVEAVVDIHCVTRWSKLAEPFSGVLLRTLIDAARPRPTAQFVSFVARSERGHSTSLPLHEALALGTLVALERRGRPLSVEEGGPARVVTPGKYFYKSLKWLERIELLTVDRLGYWEAEAGYHNQADPWLEQRFIAPSLDKRAAAQMLQSRDARGLQLLGLHAAGLSLEGLDARDAVLRNACFDRARLKGAEFGGANLSGGSFIEADLRGADFGRADLDGVDFSGADLRGADFTAVSCMGVSLTDGKRHARLSKETVLGQASVSQLAPEQQQWLADAWNERY